MKAMLIMAVVIFILLSAFISWRFCRIADIADAQEKQENDAYLKTFQIRSIADAEFFCEHILQVGIVDIKDASNWTLYHRLIKEHDGRVLCGDAHYGDDPLTTEIPYCDDKDIVRRVFAIRKSINARLRGA